MIEDPRRGKPVAGELKSGDTTDHPHFLQTYIWQELDIAPRFPVLHKFLDFWTLNLDGKLHSVRVASSALIKPAEFRLANVSLTLQ